MANFSQRLKHGKALCGKVFARFVETFNALVDFKDNLKGDADVNDGVGKIRVDRTNSAHPVIRCTGCCASDGDSDDSTSECVTSLNEETGDLTIVGGKFIKVEKVGNNTIMISYDPEKDYEDEVSEDEDPCEHPGGGFGVAAGGGNDDGSVAADEGIPASDGFGNGCNCE